MKQNIMKSNKLFSIIVVCKNEENVIRQTIKSILAQSCGDFEVIIHDGKSTDQTIQIIDELEASDKRIKLKSEEDSGIYNAMNKALAEAKGEYIYFLNAGDIFYDREVLSSVEKCIREKKTDIIIGKYLSKKHEQKVIVNPIKKENLFSYIKKGNGLCHQSIFARKECFSDGFDEQYIFSADFDWVCRQIKEERKVENIDIIIANYDKYGVSSLAKNWKKVQEECKDIIQRHFQIESELADVYYEERYKEIKSRMTLEYMNDFLALKQKNKNLSSYFEKNNIQTIAIYGYHFLGQRLYEELSGGTLKVKYVIDRNSTLYEASIPFVSLNEELENVDAIVITPIFEYYEIKAVLEKKIDCIILSIEDVINGMYE